MARHVYSVNINLTLPLLLTTLRRAAAAAAAAAPPPPPPPHRTDRNYRTCRRLRAFAAVPPALAAIVDKSDPMRRGARMPNPSGPVNGTTPTPEWECGCLLCLLLVAVEEMGEDNRLPPSDPIDGFFFRNWRSCCKDDATASKSTDFASSSSSSNGSDTAAEAMRLTRVPGDRCRWMRSEYGRDMLRLRTAFTARVM